MGSMNRLLVCLRCTANRLSVPDVLLKNTKFRPWGSLLVDGRAKSTDSWSRLTRAISSSQFSGWQPLVRTYRTARPETTGFSQNVYDENEVCIVRSSFVRSFAQ